MASALAARPSGKSATSPVAIPRSTNGASSERTVGRTGSAPSLLGTSPVNTRKVHLLKKIEGFRCRLWVNDMLQWFALACSCERYNRESQH